jgi:hypothetical protein
MMAYTVRFVSNDAGLEGITLSANVQVTNEFFPPIA